MERMRDKLMEISDFFYQGKDEEGMSVFMRTVGELAKFPEIAPWINPLFDALDQRDYMLAADILTHELAAQMQ